MGTELADRTTEHACRSERWQRHLGCEDLQGEVRDMPHLQRGWPQQAGVNHPAFKEQRQSSPSLLSFCRGPRLPARKLSTHALSLWLLTFPWSVPSVGQPQSVRRAWPTIWPGGRL